MAFLDLPVVSSNIYGPVLVYFRITQPPVERDPLKQ